MVAFDALYRVAALKRSAATRSIFHAAATPIGAGEFKRLQRGVSKITMWQPVPGICRLIDQLSKEIGLRTVSLVYSPTRPTEIRELQYSLGSSKVVTDRSASVMTHRRALLISYAENTRSPYVIASKFDCVSSAQIDPKSPY